MAGKPGKKRTKTPDMLTDKQTAFIENLMDSKSCTFADVVTSMQKAGYKHGKEPRSTAIGLLANKNILSGLLQKAQAISKTSIIRQETAKERIWSELEAALTDCKAGNDMTNRLRVIDMMGKFHQLWSDKNVVSIEVSRQLSDSYLKELRELSKLSMSGSVIDAELSDQSVATRLLQANSGVVSSPCDIQDVGDDIIDTDNSINHNTQDDTQVIDNKEDTLL